MYGGCRDRPCNTDGKLHSPVGRLCLGMEKSSPEFKLIKRGIEEGLKESSEALFDPVRS